MKIEMSKKDWQLVIEGLERTQSTATSDPERLDEITEALAQVVEDYPKSASCARIST